MGRKPGSLNKKTRMMLPMLEALGYRDPAVVLAEVVSMPELRLRKQMRTEAGRAAVAARLKAAAELMPYCHGKMPVKLEIGDNLPVFNLFFDRHQLQENQELSSPIVDHVAQDHVAQVDDLFENTQLFQDKADD